jgi:hypothetical protein
MALKIYIDSITRQTVTHWHLMLSIAEDTAPTVKLDVLNIEVDVDNQESIDTATAFIKQRFAAQKQQIIDRESTRLAVQTVLTQIEQEVG